MIDFNDNEYKNMIGNLLHDTKYIEISNMGKLSGLRKHAEIMVRKILNIGSDKKLMLGEIRTNSRNNAVNIGMENLGDCLSARLIEIVSRINPLGSDGTHTQHTDEFSDEEVESVEDALLDLYALIFIRYFLKIRVSLYTSPVVLHVFSILPPIIRLKTWSYLYEIDKNNIQVVNRLCLSIIKTFDKEAARQWLNENINEIKAIPYPTHSEKIKYIKTGGFEISPGLYQVSLDFDKFDNIYDLLSAKIEDSRTSINESGKWYKTFEDAIEHFKNFKESNIQDNTDEFYSLMEFVYIGRKSKDEL